MKSHKKKRTIDFPKDKNQFFTLSEDEIECELKEKADLDVEVVAIVKKKKKSISINDNVSVVKEISNVSSRSVEKETDNRNTNCLGMQQDVHKF